MVKSNALHASTLLWYCNIMVYHDGKLVYCKVHLMNVVQLYYIHQMNLAVTSL